MVNYHFPKLGVTVVTDNGTDAIGVALTGKHNRYNRKLGAAIAKVRLIYMLSTNHQVAVINTLRVLENYTVKFDPANCKVVKQLVESMLGYKLQKVDVEAIKVKLKNRKLSNEVPF